MIGARHNGSLVDSFKHFNGSNDVADDTSLVGSATLGKNMLTSDLACLLFHGELLIKRFKAH
jgi:hypothetical protein